MFSRLKTACLALMLLKAQQSHPAKHTQADQLIKSL